MTKKQKLAVGVSSSFLVVILVTLSIVSFADDPVPHELACKPNTWVKRADLGGVGRQGPFGFSVGSKGYIGGGWGFTPSTGQNALLADFWEYNSSNNTWTQRADFGGGKRSEATGFSIGNKGYAGTGYWVTSTNGVRTTKDFWEYNPSTNKWTQKADFTGGERDGAVGFSIANKGYIGTGDFKKDFWEYDPTVDTIKFGPGSGSWKQKASLPETAPVRTGAVGFSIGNKGYLGMGDASPANNTVFKDFYEYNPKLDSWTKKTDFGGAAGANGAGFVFDNKGYIQQGKDFQEYEPTTDKWTAKANFPLQYLNTQVGFSMGGRGYIGGGNNAGTLTKDFWMYCPGIIN